MSTYQKILRVIAVCLIVMGVFEAAIGCMLGVCTYVVENSGNVPELSASAGEAINASVSVAGQEAGVDAGSAVRELAVACASLLFNGFLAAITGAVGLWAVRRPKKIVVFLVFNVIMLCTGLFDLITNFVRDLTDPTLLAIHLVPVLLQAMALTCALSIKRGLSDGSIDAGWYEKSVQQRLEEGKKEQLGIIRFIQVIFGFCIIGSLFMCMILVSGSYNIDATFVVRFVNVVGQGVAFWLIAKRFKVARWWVIGISTFNIVVGTAGVILAGDFALQERLVTCSFDIFLILYFLFSKKAVRVLNVEFNAADQKRALIEAWDLWRPKTWDFWRSMIIYYCLFSIVGHWMEACYCLTIKYGIMPGTYDPASGIWRDYLSPFPVYGIGMVACALLLYPIKTKLQDKLGGLWKPLIGSFVANTIVVAVIELAMGLACNADLSLWDYSDMFCNFMGQICLLNSSLFGLVATLMTWVVFPGLQKLYLSLPNDIKKTLFVGVVVFYAVVICLYMVNLPTSVSV